MPREPGEYVRKVGELFIAFIHKLDQNGIIEKEEKERVYEEGMSSSEFWIGEIA